MGGEFNILKMFPRLPILPPTRSYVFRFLSVRSNSLRTGFFSFYSRVFFFVFDEERRCLENEYRQHVNTQRTKKLQRKLCVELDARESKWHGRCGAKEVT